MTRSDPLQADGPARMALARGELRYLGAMSAGLSHEIRNRLATINEKNGLLQDLVHLAGQGGRLDLARLASLTADIARLVGSVNDSCRKLSALAHTPDTEQLTVDLAQQVELVAGLMGLSTGQGGLAVELAGGQPIALESDPVLLQYLLHLCLRPAAASRAEGTISLRKADQRIHVELQGAAFSELEETSLEDVLQAVAGLGGVVAEIAGGVAIDLPPTGPPRTGSPQDEK